MSSGAIGVGMQSRSLAHKPKDLAELQALAAIGQCDLICLWRSLFGRLGRSVGQILLTRNDIADRIQYLNAQNTFMELLKLGAVPIVNENDTIAVQEIKFGDNDTLSAITAGMVQADYLFLMTDVDCLYDKNPRLHPDAVPIRKVNDMAVIESQVDIKSAGSKFGTGGMATKIVAARLATSAGVTTIITRSSNPSAIYAIVTTDGAMSETGSQPFPVPLHTRFQPSPNPIRDRSFWILHGLTPHGKVYIDEGAHQALATKAGLFPAGIISVEGTFAQHEAVQLMAVPITRRPAHRSGDPWKRDSISAYGMGSGTLNGLEAPLTPSKVALLITEGVEVGRAIVNYSAPEISKIAGCQSAEIQQLLGYADSEYVALRENISLNSKDRTSRPVTPGI